MRDVIFIGPFPPRINGVSVVNSALLEVMNRKGVGVFVLQTASSRFGHIGKVIQFILNLWFLLRSLRGSKASFYISIAGGFYQLIDIFYVTLARFSGRDIYIHHHSFKYINKKSILFSFLRFIAGDATTHVVLGRGMGEGLRQLYGVKQFRVLSNVAFVDDECGPDRIEKESSGLVVGVLSNLTSSKVGDVPEIVSKVCPANSTVRFMVGGEFVDSSLAKKFNDMERNGAPVSMLGRVPRSQIPDFYRSLDVFIFPTTYVNEAEPMVLWEAISHGVMVASYDRGVIREILECSCFKVCESAGCVAEYIQERASEKLTSSDEFLRRRREVKAYFSRRKRASVQTLEELISEVASLHLYEN